MSLEGFAIIPQLLTKEHARGLFTSYYFRNDHLHERIPDMEGIKRTSCNNMPLMRLLHMLTEKLVTNITGESLKASYSFTSAYESGSNLPAHRDRPQCVYNISLMLGGSPTWVPLTSWPLYIQYGNVTTPVALGEGDAVLYSGTRDLHWREVMPKDLALALGVFLHYVPADFTGSLD